MIKKLLRRRPTCILLYRSCCQWRNWCWRSSWDGECCPEMVLEESLIMRDWAWHSNVKPSAPPHPPRHPPRPKAPLVQILHWEPEGRRRIQNRGSVYLTKCSRMSFSFQYKTSHNRFRLSGEMTDDWNEWLCVWEVNLMDGCSVSLSFPRKIHHSGRNLFHTSPPVLKMTVNFHPLLQNGCLMINGGLALRSGSHAAPANSRWRASAKRPAALRRSAPAREEAVSLSDGSLEVPFAWAVCALTL